VKRTILIFAVTWLFAGGQARAGEYRANPQTSLLIGIDFGAAFDLDLDARSPSDWQGLNTEAYSLSAFIFGIHGGYRFNEIFGIEGGWHDQTHQTHDGYNLDGVHYDLDLGGASYQVGHLALRLAWPTSTRETPVLKVGHAMGAFAYARSSPGAIEDNNAAFVLGGIASLGVEHELVNGIVATLELAYLPLYRFGMEDELTIWMDYDYDGFYDDEDVWIDTKDFTDGRLVHLMWVLLTIQFEWTFR
jgi:hypothetical protein